MLCYVISGAKEQESLGAVCVIT